MNTIIKIALCGATGKTGKHLINQLLNQGYHVRALIRKPQNYLFSHPSLEIIEGDLKDPQAAITLLEGCTAVISTIGQIKDETLISSLATDNIISAMKKLQINRYILLTGLNLEIPGDQKSIKMKKVPYGCAICFL